LNISKIGIKISSRRLPLWLHGRNWRRRRRHSISTLININIAHVANICIFIITTMSLNILNYIIRFK
jgi:hypothetical protein